MCGRFLLVTDPATLARELEVDGEPPEFAPRFNIAPTQNVPVVVARAGTRAFAPARWGLVPSWARPGAPLQPLINARAETAATKPVFRDAYRRGRCLVPADGFYEWRGDGRARRAFCIRGADGRPLAFAGILALWQPPAGEPVETLAILTTEPNAEMRAVHDRMPCVLDGTARAAWLGGSDEPGLLGPARDGRLVVAEVGPAVNNVRNDSPACLEPPPPPEPTLF